LGGSGLQLEARLFAKPAKRLRLLLPKGRRKWVKRTPAMAAGLTDHPWTIRELALFRTPSRG
jgi:hypothetical protein